MADIIGTPAIDTTVRYAVAGMPGVAFYVHGWPKRWEESTTLCEDPETGAQWEEPTGEGEWVDDTDSGQVIVIMVGDDREHTVDVEDLSALHDADYCGGCGQTGCGW